MANNIISLDSLDLLFADFVQETLGLNDDQVLLSFREVGQPSFKINENIVYVKTFQEQDEVSIFKNRKREYDSQQEGIITTQSSLRVLVLRLVFYGPNSDTLAAQMNDSLYLYDSRSFLYNNGLSIIPNKTEHPITIYEPINERWWKRTDLRVRFYNTIVVQENVGSIESAEIEAKVSSGSKTIDLEV